MAYDQREEGHRQPSMQTRENPSMDSDGVVRVHFPGVPIAREKKESPPAKGAEPPFVDSASVFSVELGFDASTSVPADSHDELRVHLPTSRRWVDNFEWDGRADPFKIGEFLGPVRHRTRYGSIWLSDPSRNKVFDPVKGRNVIRRSRLPESSGTSAGALLGQLYNGSHWERGFLPAPKQLRPRASAWYVEASPIKTDVCRDTSATQKLEQLLGCKAQPSIRWDTEHSVTGCRLRRRAKWLHLLNAAGISSSVLKAMINGRWSPDLLIDDDYSVRAMMRLVRGGAKFLGGGTARCKPLSAEEAKKGEELEATPFIVLLDKDLGTVCFYPELVARLSTLALFRERDKSLLLTLRLRALEWAKSRRIVDVDVAEFVPASIALACSTLHPEQVASRVLDNLSDGVQPTEAPLWMRRLGDWFGGRASSMVSGESFGRSWWKKSSA
uniref:Uncharacterized protein n=1 Tax=Riboviria sp. TaxID=2585031 RepID=A0A514D9Z6_9VIRU|nr:MAG: hypothetical protein H4Bulk47719_000002 [Riboviria sp.]